MLLIVHIAIALASVGMATFTFFKPSADSLRVSYFTVLLTFLSGAALVVSNFSHLAHVCMAGLLYSLGTLTVLAVAKRKLATESDN